MRGCMLPVERWSLLRRYLAGGQGLLLRQRLLRELRMHLEQLLLLTMHLRVHFVRRHLLRDLCRHLLQRYVAGGQGLLLRQRLLRELRLRQLLVLVHTMRIRLRVVRKRLPAERHRHLLLRDMAERG